MPRPRRPLLSPELIVDTALEIIDRTGQFTIPELAHQLGVSVSSLYHHVDGRAGIVEGVRGRMAAGLGVEPTRHWQQAIVSWATAYRDAFAAHPRAIPLLVGQTVTDPTTLAAYERLADVLHRETGIDGTDLIVAITMIDNLCLGAALDLAAPSEVWDSVGRDTPFARAVSGTSHPEVAKAAFDRQLWLIVDDLERRAREVP